VLFPYRKTRARKTRAREVDEEDKTAREDQTMGTEREYLNTLGGRCARNSCAVTALVWK
jgi:hypothetical protein